MNRTGLRISLWALVAVLATATVVACRALHDARHPGPGNGLPPLYALGGKLVPPKNHDGLSFIIQAPINVVRSGKRLEIKTLYRNVGSQLRVIRLPFFGQPLVSRMVVYGPGKHHPARPTASGLAGEIDPGVRTDSRLLIFRLAPGQTKSVGRLRINSYFDMTQPGAYYIQASFCGAVSNVCRVTVKP